ncbi:MAG: LysR substrate-binding domain-containing protein [Burkholderiaceae bacterium]
MVRHSKIAIGGLSEMSAPVPNLKHLQLVVAVAEHGSITAAALAHHVSQPALSMTIKEYERTLGFPIFFRNRSKGVALTPNGRRLVQLSKKLLEDAQMFQARASGLTQSPAGSLDVSCYTPLTPHVFPPVYQRLASAHPKIELNLLEGDTLELFGHLRSGVADVAITYDMYLDEGVLFEPFAKIVPQVAVRRDDPLANCPSIRIPDLADRGMVVLDLPVVETFIGGFLRAHGADPRIRFRVKSPQMMMSLVAAGLGYAVFFIAPPDIARNGNSEVIFIPLERNAVTLNIGAAVPADVPPTALVSTFMDACRDLFRDQRVLVPYVHQV